jgi:hypothetical protein
MFGTEDLTISEIKSTTLWCDSGHKAPEKFGKDDLGNEKNTRFFKISCSKKPEVHGKIFCELCLAVANHIADQKKKGK